MSEHQQTQKSTESKSTVKKQATPRIQAPISHPMAIIQRARINPKSLTPADILQLQRTIGNRAVGRLLSEIRSSSTAQKAPVQRQEIPKEEETCPSCMQRQEIPEEEEPLQGKFETIQRLEPEEEEKLQMKSVVQRQEILEEEEPLQGKMIGTVQRQEIPEEEEPLQTKRENNTGMPDNLKAGVESLSGIDMSDVRVHYNSSKPAEVGALAYTQGTNIHVAPGQERHLPHEAWHVVQQKQERVKPTMQLQYGVQVNDDEGLEDEADVMGEKALASVVQLQSAPEKQKLIHSMFTPTLRTKSAQGEPQENKLPLLLTLLNPFELSDSSSAQVGEPLQRFKNIVFAGRKVMSFTFPAGQLFTPECLTLSELRLKLNLYSKFEGESLTTAIYLPEAQQPVVLTKAIKDLNEINAKAIQVRDKLQGNKDYESIMKDVEDVIQTSILDADEYKAKLQEASDIVQSAHQYAINLWNQVNLPTSDQLAIAYNRAKKAGILQVIPGKWWSTSLYPGPNAEMYVNISGYLWAIAHVKWHSNPITFENVDMANFKTPVNSSIPNSKIDNDEVKRSLVVEALRYGKSAPQPQHKTGEKPMT